MEKPNASIAWGHRLVCASLLHLCCSGSLYAAWPGKLPAPCGQAEPWSTYTWVFKCTLKLVFPREVMPGRECRERNSNNPCTAPVMHSYAPFIAPLRIDLNQYPPLLKFWRENTAALRLFLGSLPQHSSSCISTSAHAWPRAAAGCCAAGAALADPTQVPFWPPLTQNE